jgi:predicted TIM-barrel fold metal-dependent hydrolase
MDEVRGIQQRHDLGVDKIMWSTDFPHPATTWPHSQDFVTKNFAGVPEDETERMVCGNAAALYRL